MINKSIRKTARITVILSPGTGKYNNLDNKSYISIYPSTAQAKAQEILLFLELLVTKYTSLNNLRHWVLKIGMQQLMRFPFPT